MRRARQKQRTHLGLGIRVDIGKQVGKDRNQNGDEHDVAQDGVADEHNGPKHGMKLRSSRETEVGRAEEYLPKCEISFSQTVPRGSTHSISQMICLTVHVPLANVQRQKQMPLKATTSG